MRSNAWLALVALGACSPAPSSTGIDPALQRPCPAPVALACSRLAVVTPREVVPFSSMPTGTLLARNGAFDDAEGPLLQHYVIDGSPPRFHATSNALLSPGVPEGAIATDGAELFGYDGVAHRFFAWDASNAPIGEASFDVLENTSNGEIAAVSGLALLAASSTYAEKDFAKERLLVFDDRGRLGFRDDRTTTSIGAYGCGFALIDSDHGQLTTLPIDGRAPSTQPFVTSPSTWSVATSWPYDPHGVALITSAFACAVTLVVTFDDGRPPLSRSFTPPCSGSADLGSALLSTSFGAVLDMEGRIFQLLDADASPVGDPLTVDVRGDEAQTRVAAAGAFVAVVANEETLQPPSSTFTESVLGCAP